MDDFPLKPIDGESAIALTADMASEASLLARKAIHISDWDSPETKNHRENARARAHPWWWLELGVLKTNFRKVVEERGVKEKLLRLRSGVRCFCTSGVWGFA